MKKEDYFKYALKKRYYRFKSWILGTFGIVTEDVFVNDQKKDESVINLEEANLAKVPVIKTNGSFKLVYVDGEYVKIEGVVPNEPIFSFDDSIILNKGDLPNITETVDTTYGRALANAILFVEAFHDKVDYVNDHIKTKDIENIVVPRLVDNIPLEQRDKNNKTKLYVDEYLKLTDGFSFLGGLSLISVHSGSAVTISPPTGLKEFKDKLLKKYHGKLSDPVQLVAFENELREFDKEYLKQDPSFGIFMEGKQLSVVRRKLFLDIGSDGGFDTSVKVNPVLNSLEDGWPRDAQQFTDLLNGTRVGLYGRGKGTIKGGVTAKTMFRISNNFQILEDDCGTERGIEYLLNERNIQSKVGRYVRLDKKWVFIDNIDMIKPYVGKKMMFRSPMYCRCEGDRICKYCAGSKLSINPNALSTSLSEFSGVILSIEMDKMHGKVMSTAKLRLNELIT